MTLKKKSVQVTVKRRPAVLGGVPAFKKPIAITKPTIPPISGIKKDLEKVLASGMITNAGYVKDFEKKVADYIGVKNAIAVNSCTSGLMLLMRSLQLKGEVILPSFTFHATAHAVVWNNLTPVFVDCDREKFTIDPVEVERSLTPRTAAIIGVHIFGNPAPALALQEISRRRNIPLFFDAAHGFGSVLQGKRIGSFGTAESFSLSPTKLLTTAEGGIVATNSDALAADIRKGRNYGDSGDYDCAWPGFNARMSELHAVLGLHSLKYLEQNVRRRNRLAEIYTKKLGELPGIGFQKIDQGDRSSLKDFSIIVDEKRFGMTRDRLAEALTAENIVVKKYFYPPVHWQKAYKANASSQKNKFVNTDYVTTHCLSLPLFSHMKEKDVREIIQAIERIHESRLVS